jgi:hypothetical protein
MVSYAIGVTLRYTLKNHIFKFNGVFYKQPKGGAIGVGIAGDVATLFMVWYDQKLLQSLNKCHIDIRLYARYVDDINIISRSISSDDGDSSEPADKRTMLEIQRIANTIHNSIQVTVDYPSNHASGRMPVLDLEQWIQPVEIDGNVKSQIMHSHYMKPMSSKHVISKASALPMSTKMNILTADLIRVMRNVSEHCDAEEREKHVQHYVHRMQYSGYNQTDRVAVYKKAKRCFDSIVQDAANGTKPLYRPKTYQRETREKEKKNKQRNWYGKGGDETVMFVDATPGSVLAKKFRDTLTSCGLKIRVVERTGDSIKSLLTKSDPFRTKTCDPTSCIVCSAFPKISCKTRDCVYKITCKGCGEFYIGETSRSIGQRYAEHCVQQRNQSSSSVFAPHFKTKHGSNQQDLELKVLKSCPGDPMLRQVTEAVHIAIEKPSLNTKQEWRRRIMSDTTVDVNVV